MTQFPPMITGVPVLGNLPEFVRNRNGLIRRGYNAYGPIFSFKLVNKTVTVLVGPDYHQWFFTETDKSLDIEKPYEQLAAMFGKVAFLAPKAEYQNQHPILYAPFKPEKMLTYVQVMQREVQKWIDSLGEEGVFDLSAAMSTLVQEVAGYAFLGDQTQQTLGREFWDLYAVLGKSLASFVPTHWPTPQNRRREQAKKAMSHLLAPIIAERRRHPEQYDDFLQSFVNTPFRDGTPSDDETLIGLLRALMFASHETTAGQAAWTVIELLRHPVYRSLVEREIAESLPFGTLFDARSLRKMEHIFWAVREIERLHPSGDAVMRLNEHEQEIGGYTIPADSLVMLNANISHRLPTIFSDPDAFDPLRFAPQRAEDKQHGYALIGFGGGKHKCAGMNFANNEMMVITALIFQQLDMELLTLNPQVVYDQGAGRPEPTMVRFRRRAVPLEAEPVFANAIA